MRIIPLLTCLLLIVFVGTIWSQEPMSGTNEPSSPVIASKNPHHPQSPMMIEIKELLAIEECEVAELRNQVLATMEPGRRIELIRAIHDLKAETEVDILRVQLKHARLAGRSDTVLELEEAIEFMTNPRPVPAPRERVQRPRPQSRGR